MKLYVVLSFLFTMLAHGQVVNEDFKLLPLTGSVSAHFGSAVAIDQGVIAVGKPGDDTLGENVGSVYLFDSRTGEQIKVILPELGEDEWGFGYRLAMGDGVLAVGSYAVQPDGARFNSVTLYDSLSGELLFKLVPGDTESVLYLGVDIAIENNIVVIGAGGDDVVGTASGAVYLFDISAGQLLHRLVPEDGKRNDYFGRSVAIDHGIVAVGATGVDDHGAGSGAAYLFDASTGDQIAKVVPDQVEEEDWFGHSIAIQDDLLVVGANGDDFVRLNSGAVYLYEVSSGLQVAKVHPSKPSQFGRFGWDVAIDHDRIVVAADFAFNNVLYAGAVYLLDVQSGSEVSRLLPSDRQRDDHFGSALAFSDGVVVVGAEDDDDQGDGSGSAYVFHLCPADFNRDGILDFFDLSIFIHAFMAGELLADVNLDGQYDFFDVIVIVSEFQLGCP